MMPGQQPTDSNAWKNGIDEWGRTWQDGVYAGGVVENEMDLNKYSPTPAYSTQFFDPESVRAVRQVYPDHCMIFGTHIGPFNASYMAMGFERFFTRLIEEPIFIHKLLEKRTEWCIAMFQTAVRLGAEVIVMGDDAAHNQGPMISPRLWRQHILPYHKQVVNSIGVPVIWHSDGNIKQLLPMAIEAGFIGIHGVDAVAGMNLALIKREFGRDLVLIGNLDVRLLFDADLDAIRQEVDRCYDEGSSGSGYLFASCNSICTGMNPAAVKEMFRCASAKS
jgi:uroporphyrinogen decarboxylase